MGKIVQCIKTFLAEDFKLGKYLLQILLLTIFICFNYYYDFEDKVIDAYAGREIRMLFYFLMYGFAYYASCLITACSQPHSFILRSDFWFKSSFFLALLAFDAAFFYHRPLIQVTFPSEIHYYLIKIGNNLKSLLTIFIPLAIFYVSYEKDKNRFYGFTAKGIDLRPYGILLLLMVPLIVAASFEESFIQYYPSLKDNLAAWYLGIPKWVTIVIFELAYAFDFIAVELVFRGCMVIGLIKVMGKDAVLPMVVTYAVYHFGKPAGEAISAIFGGYILGIIAYNTRSILGGIVVHIGVAWLMDFFAFLQKQIP